MPFDSQEFRKVLGQFATGVAVVTTKLDGVPQGMTVNSFTSVSLEPPLVLFCADKRTRTNEVVGKSGVFAVNVLREEQRRLSEIFAGQGTDEERKAVLWAREALATGAPVIEGSLGWMDCRVRQVIDAGDHVIYLGEVLDAGRGPMGAPLLYYRGTYQAMREAWRWTDRYAAKEHTTRFDEMVDFFERMQTDSPFGKLLQEFAAFASPTSTDICLDLGCGPGRLVRELAGRAKKALGIDESVPMIERATQRANEAGLTNAQYVVGQAERINAPDGSYDLVTASNILFFLADPVTALKEIRRVLRPGGRVALLNPSTGMKQATMAEYVGKQRYTGFGADCLLSWSEAAAANRPYDETRMDADLAAAGFVSPRHERRLDGLVLLTVATRSN